MESVNDFVNAAKVGQRFDIRHEARTEVIAETKLLAFVKLEAFC